MSLIKEILRISEIKTPKPASAKDLKNKILTYLEEGRFRKAVNVLYTAHVPLPYSIYAHLFQHCSSRRAIVEARKVEYHLNHFLPNPPVFLLNRAIETFGKCGCLDDARELFEEMRERDGGSWNAIITAHSQSGYANEALALFLRMNRNGVFSNAVTFASVLGSCAAVSDLDLSRQIHGLTLKYDFASNVILETSLVDIYGKCGAITDARRKFDEIHNPNAVSWNVIVRRYFEMDDGKEAVYMFFQMFPAAVRPLNFTFSTALAACSSIHALKEGMQIHGVSIKMHFDVDKVVSCSLIHMYVKCGKLEDAHAIFEQPNEKDLIFWTTIISGYAMSGKTREARKLFNDMPERNVVSWNAMLGGYTRFSLWEEALDFVYLMRNTTKDIDHVTLGLILNICSGLSDVELGKQIHGYIYRHGFCSNLIVSNALLDMYGKCGNLRSARVWFYQMSEWRDNVSWNALLASHARHQMSEEAMSIFWEMQCETRPSKFTFATLLAACANIFALDQGRQIHGFIIRNSYEIDIVLKAALVDMYSKCRCLEYALMVFKEGEEMDVILCNSIILGCCHNRQGREVLKLFGFMEEKGVKPDHVTLLGVLLACAHEGLVELGTQYFHSITDKYGIIPRIEHYDMMIELHSRYEQMDELENFIKTMPFEPTVSMLTKVLDASRKHGHLRMGKWAAERLNES
uniref:pentatricopeptide repeat-containing protein At3g26540 n=1 Tax=Ziziphus jujuba TaxID=326968 RepID=A0A6P4AIS5_ZIZJJ